MEFEKIITDLRNKVYHPVYFLMGEEPFFIDEVSNYIEKNILDDSEKEFNQTILYGGETNIHTVLGEAKGYPMMSNYRVVIIKEAQNMKDLIPKEEKEKTDKVKEEGKEKESPLLKYLDNPQKSTMLVFCYKYKTVDMRTAVGKAISKKAAVLNSKKYYDNEIPAWVESFVKKNKFTIEPQASIILTEFLGNDMSKIAKEIEKLAINLPEKTNITKDHIHQFIGISKEYNNFELQNALGRRDELKAFRIANYFKHHFKDGDYIMTVALLGSYFTKLLLYHALQDRSERNVASALKVHPFFVKDYLRAAANFHSGKVISNISILRKYDMKFKGLEGDTDKGELLRELVYRLIH